MARSKATNSQDTLDLTALEQGESLVFGSSQMTLFKGESKRFVIAFSDVPLAPGKPDQMQWLLDLRRQHGWTLLLVQALQNDWYAETDLRRGLTALAKTPLVLNAGHVSLFGTGMGGLAALRFGGIWPNATIQSFSPHSARAQAPLPKAANLSATEKRALGTHAGKIYLFTDPLQQTHKPLLKDLPEDNLAWIKCIGIGDECAANLSRMKIFAPVLVSAMRGTLVPAWFYKTLRSRKTYYFYRLAIETALSDRGQAGRISGFRQTFRSLRNQVPDAHKSLHATAQAQRRIGPSAWVAPRSTIQSNTSTPLPWPVEGGNIWMLDARNGALHYMSDRWEKTCIGYEERAGVTLAQTPSQALGFVGFGHGLNTERDLPRRFPWHVTDETLDGTCAPFSAQSEATIHSEILFETRQAQPSLIAITQSHPGLTPTEAMPGSAGYDDLLGRLRRAATRMVLWGKTLHVDRLRLALGAATPLSSAQDAAEHYTNVAQSLTADICEITQQRSRPVITVVQSAGTRTNGHSLLALAEGRADLDNPALPFIVVSPSYPFPLMDDTTATVTAQAAMLLDEMISLAVLEHQAGRRWYCPSLQLAHLDGSQIIAQFSSLEGLELDPEKPHGFSLMAQSGEDVIPEITNAEVISDTQICLTCATPPKTAHLSLCYAWGNTCTPADGRKSKYSANQGGLRDRWERPSLMLPDQILRRYALSGRVLLSRA